jgi:2-iminoacetate synthase
VPRIKPADDIDPETCDNSVPDDVFKRIVAVLRIAVPYTGMIMSTRESEKTRRECLEIGITQISGGSRTSVGGYAEEERQEDTAQFDVEDRRTLAEVVDWLIELGYVPSFCTACYREGRTGDRFMHLLKTGQIANCCQPNALMTLKEFLMDYASEETQAKGDEIIAKRLAMIPNEKVREIATERLGLIEKGTRDFRF